MDEHLASTGKSDSRHCGRKIQLPCDEEYLNTLADVYQAALAQALTLKCGALNLLTTLKKLSKEIAINSKGREDAQVWTVEQLGFAHMVYFLATTNRFRVSKVDGLLRKSWMRSR